LRTCSLRRLIVIPMWILTRRRMDNYRT
jgi:hypothetical protein